MFCHIGKHVIPKEFTDDYLPFWRICGAEVACSPCYWTFRNLLEVRNNARPTSDETIVIGDS
jgi:hypothetical protein